MIKYQHIPGMIQSKKQIPELVDASLNCIENKKAIAFLGINAGDGVTTAAIATARAASLHLASKVLLVDNNYHQPALRTIFNVQSPKGFSDILQQPEEFWNQMIHPIENGLDIIPFGQDPPHVTKQILTSNFHHWIQKLKTSYDHVFFDMGAIRQNPLSLKLISLFDGVVFVVACERTRWEIAQFEKQKLESANARILGVVMNRRKFYIPRWIYNSL